MIAQSKTILNENSNKSAGKDSEADPGYYDAEPASKPSSRGKQASFLSKFLPLGKKLTVGVDIGYGHLRMVKISKASAQKHEIVDYYLMPLQPGIDHNTWFPEMLKNAFHDFGIIPGRCEIWTSISMASFQMRYLALPIIPKKKMAHAARWTYKQEAPMGENGRVFDFRVLGKIRRDGVNKLETIAYTAPKDEIEGVKNLFESIGFPLTGISVFPFFRQNLFKMRWVDNYSLNTCSLFIGKRRSHIDIFDTRGNLVLSRGIRAGTNSMIEALKEELEADFERSKALFFQLVGGVESPDNEADHYTNSDLMIRIILPALERLVRQVKITIEHSSSILKGKGVEKVFLSGEMGAYKLLVNYIGIQLDLPMESIDPFSGHETWRQDKIPQTSVERASFTPTVGMALSENPHTPNLIYTYKDKEKSLKIHRLNQLILVFFIMLSVLLVGVDLWQGKIISEKKKELGRLHKRIQAISPVVDKKLIAESVAVHRKKCTRLKSYGKKMLFMAAMKEITNLTPKNIRLLGINGNFGVASATDSVSTIQIDGIVLGENLLFETTLAAYLLSLEKSPVFKKQSLTNKSFDFVDSKEGLRFTTLLKLM